MTAIRTEGLRKEYKDVVAVEGLDLEIEEGELFSLLGVNGAGKTTTVKMLSGLTVPTAGDAAVCGASVVKEPDRVKESIDVSMQETAIARKLTVEENIAFYAAMRGHSKEQIEEDKKYVYSVFGLDSVAKRYAGKLSGGWQRKLSVALALISRPKVLFLDEPTLGLDVIARRELWRTIRELKGNTHHSLYGGGGGALRPHRRDEGRETPLRRHARGNVRVDGQGKRRGSVHRDRHGR